MAYDNTPNLDYGGPLLGVGYAGQLSHSLGPADIDSKVNEGATAIDAGIAVARGAADNTCTAVTTTTTAAQLLGITVRSPMRPADTAAGQVYKQYDTVPILKTGWAWAPVAAAVTRGGKVGVSVTAGTLGQLGPSGTGYVDLAGATFETSQATKDGLALVRFVS